MATTTKSQSRKTPKDYIFAVGRRKTSVARVRLFQKGDGSITVNGKPFKEYFVYGYHQEPITQALEAVGKPKDYTITIKVAGGGIHGQSEACRHGISRALLKTEEGHRPILKPLGYLTRDPRRKERKKPGLKRARRAPQWAKR